MKVKYLGIIVGMVLAAMLFVGAGAASVAVDSNYPEQDYNNNINDTKNAMLKMGLVDQSFPPKTLPGVSDIGRIMRQEFDEFLAGIENNPVAFLVAAIEDIQGLGHDYLGRIQAANARFCPP